MPSPTSRVITLRRYPTGMPQVEDFELKEWPLAAPGDGEVQVQNLWMTVDPYMRGRMRPGKSYVAAFELDAPLEGEAIGRVVASRHPDFAAGDLVRSMRGWREAYVCPAGELQKLPSADAPPQAFLGVLGMPGLTAWVGLLKIAEPKAGETVFVSAASGAVGAMVCQIAKLKGCTVVGAAGSDAKVDWLLTELGIDHALNYKTYKTAGSLSKALAAACPNGIDIYFDNVGGDHLTAALNVLNDFGRIAACGMISQYNAAEPPPGPPNLINIVGRRLRMQGFIVADHFDLYPAFLDDMTEWMGAGKITWKETVLEGLENAPQAFLNLFTGDNFGKMLVKLSD